MTGKTWTGNTLSTIRSDYLDVDPCLSKCLTLWLEGADRVKETTWSTLAIALEDEYINNKKAANFISKLRNIEIYYKYSFRKERR